MASRFRFIAAIVILLSTAGCKIFPAEFPLERALKLAGSNREELEKVLDRYSKVPGDSLKYRAAVFLIENMPYYSYYEGTQLNHFLEYFPLLYEVRKQNFGPSVAVDSIKRQYGYLDRKSLDYKNDIAHVDSAYLYDNIEQAFKVWTEQPWGKNVAFKDFCEYILPYRIGDEVLPLWREKYYSEYNHILDNLRNSDGNGKESPIMAALCISDSLLQPGQLYFTSVAPAELPHAGPDAVESRSGSCKELSDFVIYVCRALGIPCAIDFMPIRGDDNVGHFWVSFWDENGELYCQEFSDKVEKVNGSKLWHDSKTKVYRKTFGINNTIYKDFLHTDDIADLFKEPCIIDVTEQYASGYIDKLQIPETEIYPGKRPEVIYLCLSSWMSWVPVDYSLWKDDDVIFKNIDKGAIMRVASLKDGKMRFWTDPFYVDDSHMLHFYRSDGKKNDLVLYSKFPLSFENHLRERVAGGVFEGSNDPLFILKDTLYVIDALPDRLYTSVLPDQGTKYQYVRYYGPGNGFCNIAEIGFYGIDGEKLTGNIIGTTDCSGNDGTHEYRNAFDGKTWTSFDYMEPSGGWTGMCFSAPVQIGKIIYTPRNTDNYIRPGDDYELFYCDTLWHSAGTKKASSDSLVFNDVPQNVLYLLKNHTRGIQERIFTYENNVQVWNRQRTGKCLSIADSNFLKLSIARMSYEEEWSGHYIFTYPGEAWMAPDYDDSAWRYGIAAFGTSDQRSVRTRFKTNDIWVRRYVEFDPDEIKGKRIILRYSHDDVFQLYINGIEVVQTGLEWRNDVELEIPDNVISTMMSGHTVIAAHCRNTYGGALVDFGIYLD
ncbi:MAG: transglutaminase-like domain-containing protein [Bacteroidales bacterium]|nr:transglutaminase-like domain-containing protein [Bacteroidales bacterium]